MINRSLLNIGLYIQPLEICLAFSCPFTLCPSISCQSTSRPVTLSKFVLYFHVRQFHAWTLGPSNSCPPILCMDIWSIYFMSVKFMPFSASPLFETCPFLDNGVLKQCFISYSQSVEFVSMCYDFDVMIDICTEQNIRHKIFEHFSCAVKVISF